jgi:hypothetical protein
MKPNIHTLTVSVADTEIEVEVKFTSSPFVPEQGPSYSSGGQPAEGGEVEILSGTVIIGKARHPCPPWLLTIIESDESVIDDLRESADEDDEPDWDAISDARRERNAA